MFVAILNQTQPAKSLGVVVSASHNKIQDNGLKITNFHGNMLEMEYEPVLEEFVNTENLSEAIEKFKEYLKKHDRIVYTSPVYVCIGGDTRPSTPKLLQLLTYPASLMQRRRAQPERQSPELRLSDHPTAPILR